MKRKQELKFESELFNLARNTLDAVLNRTILDMLIKAADDATITLKINVSLIPTEDAEDLADDDPANWTPVFDCDVSSQIKSTYKLSAPVEHAGHLQRDHDGKLSAGRRSADEN